MACRGCARHEDALDAGCGNFNERSGALRRINVVATSRRDDTDSWLRPHRAPLVGFVLPLVNGDLQAAEDVVQETMLRGWQHSTELEQEKAGSWLRTVARNIAISAYHRRRRSRPSEVPLDENTFPDAADGVDRIPDAWLLGDALNSLNPGHRAVITELFYHRKTVAEVAEMLGIPEGTVRSRCFYGLRALRTALEKQGITRP
jgi:RNA polymerase sigma-70 factor, ECF subfamily